MENYRYKRYVKTNQETRWASASEIQDSSTYIRLSDDHYPTAGLPLISDAREAYVDGKDTHSLIFGATGSKKTRLFCMPMLGMFIKAGESFIATDPKGELYRKTSGLAKANGYNTVVLNFRDIGKGDLWNPLAVPYELYHSGRQEEAVSMLNDFVQTLASPQFERTKDVFWPEMASSFAIANLMLLMECASKEEANVISLSRLCSLDLERKLTDLSEPMSEYTIAGMNYKNVFTGAEKTRQSIYISLYGMIRVFNTQKKLATMLSGNTVDLTRIGREKTALYIIVPDEKTTLHFLVTTFIKQAYEILIREADAEAIRGVKDLDGRNIVAQSGSLQEALMMGHVLNYREFRRLGSMQEVYDFLAEGKADAAMVDLGSAREYMNNNPDSGLMLVPGVRFTQEERFQGDRVAARKGETQLIAFVNGVIDELLASGQYMTWYGESVALAARLGL